MITLLPVPGFGSWPDGRLRAGPFPLEDISSLHSMLNIYGVYPGMQGDRAMVSSTPSGLMISASGPGVRGYFLDSDGIEVCQSDLDEMILECTRPGAAFRISGHWCPDAGRMIVSESMAFHDRQFVEWSRSRMIMHADGSILPITGGGLAGDKTPQLRIVRNA